MDASGLRPLGLGELLDLTFSYYRRHFWFFMGLMAVVEVPKVVLNLGLILFQRPSPPSNPIYSASTHLASEGIGPGFLAVFVGVHSLVSLAALAAIAIAVSDLHLHRPITIRAAFAGLRGKVGRLIGTHFLSLLLVIGVYALIAMAALLTGGVIASVVRLALGGSSDVQIIVGFLITLILGAGLVGGGIFLLRFSLTIPVLMLENAGPVQSLKRSYALTKGYVWRLFIVVLLMLVIITVLTAIFQGPFYAAASLMGSRFGAAPMWLNIPWVISAAAGGSLALPLIMIALALVYYDTRVSKEGLDLQLMMNAIDHLPPAVQSALPLTINSGLASPAAAMLEAGNIPLLILLTVVTAGIYIPCWFLKRARGLNSLRSGDRLHSATFVVILSVEGLAFVLGFLSGVTESVAFTELANLLGLSAGVLLLAQSFKARAMLRDHVRAVNPSRAHYSLTEWDNDFSAVATFFFGIFYLQYKINRLIKLGAPAPSRPLYTGSASFTSSMAGPLPAAPSTSPSTAGSKYRILKL